MEVEYQPIDEYEHQIVTTEEGKCKCNKEHETGDVVWGGVTDPRELVSIDPFESVNNLHSLSVEYSRREDSPE